MITRGRKKPRLLTVDEVPLQRDCGVSRYQGSLRLRQEGLHKGSLGGFRVRRFGERGGQYGVRLKN